jgi:HEAT repeat protein
MAEALARNSTEFVSVVDGLARIQTPEAIRILIHSFDTSEAFVRLAAWEALHRVDASALSPELRQEVSRVLNATPIYVLE